jgi:DNA polymerase III alpha subunit
MLAFGPHRFPAVPMPGGVDGGAGATAPGEPSGAASGAATDATPDARLRALCHVGLTDRYCAGDPALWRRAARQIAEELAVIADLGLAPFFLLVADVVRFAQERDIPCQGRGSATGSVVAYTLGVARVEPLGQRLLFARFLSRERGSLPDIDLDFGHACRAEVIRYLYATYGAAHVGMASTFQTYHTRGAVRDVGRALGLPAPGVEAVARRVRQRLDDDLAGAVRAAVGDDALALPPWGHLVALCARLVGTPRHVGIHNGGVVVTGPPLGDLVPLEQATMPGRVVVQFDKDSLELAGLIKLECCRSRRSTWPTRPHGWCGSTRGSRSTWHGSPTRRAARGPAARAPPTVRRASPRRRRAPPARAPGRSRRDGRRAPPTRSSWSRAAPP